MCVELGVYTVQTGMTIISLVIFPNLYIFLDEVIVYVNMK